MLILGVIKEIHDYKLLVSLPSGIRGTVHITNVSQTYTDLLQRLAADETPQGLEVGNWKFK